MGLTAGIGAGIRARKAGGTFDPIGVSNKDLSLLNDGIFSDMRILYKGAEYQVIYPGNQYLNTGDYGAFIYSLKNLGKW